MCDLQNRNQFISGHSGARFRPLRCAGNQRKALRAQSNIPTSEIEVGGDAQGTAPTEMLWKGTGQDGLALDPPLVMTWRLWMEDSVL